MRVPGLREVRSQSLYDSNTLATSGSSFNFSFFSNSTPKTWSIIIEIIKYLHKRLGGQNPLPLLPYLSYYFKKDVPALIEDAISLVNYTVTSDSFEKGNLIDTNVKESNIEVSQILIAILPKTEWANILVKATPKAAAYYSEKLKKLG